MDFLWLVGLLLIVFCALWSKIATQLGSPRVRGDVLLVIAHPDDEAMFFTPTLECLRRLNIRVHLLCLSTGDAGGLGHVREKELRSSGKYFELASVRIVDDENLRDGKENQWEASVVARHLRLTLDQLGTVRTVLTFDRHGVSGHPNHVAVHNGVALLKSTLPPGILFMQLTSHTLLSKYSGLLSIPLLLRRANAVKHWTVVVRPEASLASFFAMKCHASQFVWFRYLFVVFSRYSFVNEVREL